MVDRLEHYFATVYRCHRLLRKHQNHPYTSAPCSKHQIALVQLKVFPGFYLLPSTSGGRQSPVEDQDSCPSGRIYGLPQSSPGLLFYFCQVCSSTTLVSSSYRLIFHHQRHSECVDFRHTHSGRVWISSRSKYCRRCLSMPAVSHIRIATRMMASMREACTRGYR